ncbi:cytochrome c1 [Sphingomonas japonica]|uniref:Cytochrome c1 n=1 Tax=Sphingomonas japonica TaxID=511662 RepID=A0ABX0TXC0_9SPHN|nr:cytochrome c1 [Sphingomonas japonica]NIJ22944.1 ubiquinol-cytochrome c reductase cytochrome c1 subunit [Sphingomonas japonica]
MLRKLIGPIIGLGFVFVLLLSLGTTVYSAVTEPAAETVEHEFHKEPRHLDIASNGLMGKFDRAQLQRGLQVYKEVCSACHSLKLVSFRNLADLGYTEAEVAGFAKGFQVPSINPETGETATRDGLPADRFPLIYPNEVAARAANNNAIPPDLSLMTKAREEGPSYIYSLLTGYQAQPAELLQKFPNAVTPPGLHYNPYFPTLNLAMAPPLVADNQVTYADGTPATIDQMAKDIAAFLVWTAEPKLEARHQGGLAAIIFILIFTGLAFGAYRNIWRGVKH